MDRTSYDNEGYSALDVPTTAALQYMRDTAAAAARRAAANRELAEISPNAARILLVVDAGCDMPSNWLAKHNVAVVPVDVARDAEQVRDHGDELDRMQFADRLNGPKEQRPTLLEISPARPVQIRDYLQTWMTPTIDFVVQITFSASRSSVYLSSLAASQSLMLIHNKVRRSLGSSGPLKAWVIDSFTGLAGVGVLVAHAVRLRNSGMPAGEIAMTLENFRKQVRTLIVPDDLGFLFRAVHSKGASGDGMPRWKYWWARFLDLRPVLIAERGTGGMLTRVKSFEGACERVLSIATRHVALGLSTPTVCISVAGDGEALRALPGFGLLSAECKLHRVELLLTPMSMMGCVKLGPGAISVAFASERFHG
jgi:fatty acid-binding protein DegV